MRILSLVGMALVGGFLLSGTAWATEDLAVEDLIVEKEFKRNAGNMAFGYGSLWVATGFKVLRIDAANNEIAEIELEGATQRQRRVAVGEGAVWIPDVGKGVVFKIDPESDAVVAEIPVNMLSTQGSIENCRKIQRPERRATGIDYSARRWGRCGR